MGLGYNDLDFSDNLAVLHSQHGLVNIFEDEFDQVALYQGSSDASHFSIFIPLFSSGNVSRVEYIYVDNPERSNQIGYISAFVAWGADPLNDGSNAIDAGIWFSSDFLHCSGVDNDTTAQIYGNESIGINEQGDKAFPGKV